MKLGKLLGGSLVKQIAQGVVTALLDRRERKRAEREERVKP